METVAPLGDPASVVAYSRRVFHQSTRATTMAKLMAVSLNPKDQCNFVQWFDELSKGPGAEVQFQLLTNAVGAGVIGDGVMKGNEVPLTWEVDTLKINQLRQAHRVAGRMSQQRVPFSLRNGCKVSLANWWKRRLDVWLGNQLGGNTAQTDIAYTGLNPVFAPDAAHHLFANGATNENQLVSTAFNFKWSLIPEYIAKANGTLPFPIKPVVIRGVEIKGIAFLHPTQVRDLKTNFDPGEWGSIYLAALQGGQVTGNPIFAGAIGFKEGVVLHENAQVPWGDTAQNVIYDPATRTMIPAETNLGTPAAGVTSVGRAIIVGAQAGCFANGAADVDATGQPLHVKWVEELYDGQNQLLVYAGMIAGFKKTRFLDQDFATVVVSTYAQP